MTDQEIRIAIAESRGWKATKFYADGSPRIWTNSKGHVLNWCEHDYPNDLNAMREACQYAKEHLMDADQWEEFGRLLEASHPSAVLLDIGKIDYYDLATLIADVTARDIATAFLRTIGKWKE